MISRRDVLTELNISDKTLKALIISGIFGECLTSRSHFNKQEIKLLQEFNIKSILGMNGCINAGVELNRYKNKLKNIL